MDSYAPVVVATAGLLVASRPTRRLTAAPSFALGSDVLQIAHARAGGLLSSSAPTVGRCSSATRRQVRGADGGEIRGIGAAASSVDDKLLHRASHWKATVPPPRLRCAIV